MLYIRCDKKKRDQAKARMKAIKEMGERNNIDIVLSALSDYKDLLLPSKSEVDRMINDPEVIEKTAERILEENR